MEKLYNFIAASFVLPRPSDPVTPNASSSGFWRKGPAILGVAITLAAIVAPGGTVFGEDPPAGAMTDPLINLVANADFRAKDPEQRALRWVTGQGNQRVTVTRKEWHSREKDDSSLEIIDASATEGALARSEKRLANPGTLYLASAWVKGGEGTPATLYLEFWDQNAVRIGVQSVRPDFAPTWQRVTVSLAAPDHTTHTSLAIASGQSEIGRSYWDDIALVPQIRYDPHLASGVRELFVDDYRIDSLTDIQRQIHPGVKTAPLLTPTEPWEHHSVYIYGTVLHDTPEGSGYRMWYTSYRDGDYFLCYATSDDGLTWQKPRLGIVDFQGSSENNITLIGGGTLVYDPDDVDNNKRYKLMSYVAKPKERAGYWVYFSPDGLHWTPNAKNPVILYGDVSNVAYDRSHRLFIASTKQRMLMANTSVTPGKQDRAAFISVSSNFTDWSAPGASKSEWTLAVEGDPRDDFAVMARGGIEAQIYGMPVFPYEGMYLGFPWVFEIMNYHSGIYAATGDGPIQPQLAASRDLRLWSRPLRDPILPLGAAGAWDDSTLYTASNLLISPNQVEIYYGGMNLPHGGDTITQTQFARIAKATWRRDGFVSLHNAGDDEGIVTTKDLVVPQATQLHVNATVSGGSLKVEILGPSGDPLSNFTAPKASVITGDQTDAVVSWSGQEEVSSLAGRTVKLRFHLSKGDLYSYWFK